MVAAVGDGGVAAAAEQDQQDDDPAHITATIVVKHRNTSKIF